MTGDLGQDASRAESDNAHNAEGPQSAAEAAAADAETERFRQWLRLLLFELLLLLTQVIVHLSNTPAGNASSV